MRTLTKAVILFMFFCMQSTVYADCPDGKHYCPNTGNTITYGKCWSWSSKSCKPCRPYKDKCKNGLYNRWMSTDNKIQNSSLSEITIPGAHDAGMGKITTCSDYAGSDVTKTQNRSFSQMLNSGTRYFDVRPVINKNGDIYLGHYSWIDKDIDIPLIHKFTLRNEGCFGYSMDEMLDDVRAFVSNSTPSNKEIIVLKFSHFMNFEKFDIENSRFDKNDFKQLIAKIINKLSGYLVLGNKNFLKTKINHLTGNGAKVIVTFDADGYDGSKGIYSQTYLNLYDKYSNTNNYKKMKTDQFEKLSNYSYSKYFVLSWTLTQSENQAIGCMIPGNAGKLFGYDCEPIRSLANSANRHLLDIQEQSIKTKKYPNVIYTDYISEKQTKISININKDR